VIKTVETLETGFPAICEVGNYVSIGAGSTLISCTVGDNVDIGEGCVLLEGSLVEDNAVLAPGTVLGKGARIPTGEKWAGAPAEFVSKLSEEEVEAITTKVQTIRSRGQELYMEYLPLCGDP